MKCFLHTTFLHRQSHRHRLHILPLNQKHRYLVSSNCFWFLGKRKTFAGQSETTDILATHLWPFKIHLKIHTPVFGHTNFSLLLFFVTCFRLKESRYQLYTCSPFVCKFSLLHNQRHVYCLRSRKVHHIFFLDGWEFPKVLWWEIGENIDLVGVSG